MQTPQKLPDVPLDSPVKKQSGKNEHLSGHTFLMTISPKGDVSETCQSKLLKWIIKTTEYSYVVAEVGKNGQRHIHACLVFATSRNKQCLQEDTWKYRVKKWHGDSIGQFAVVVTNMYNHDWYNDYLRKETGVEVLHDAYHPDEITPLFPTPAQQELFQALKGKKVADAVLHQHQVLWEETEHPVTVAGALAYLRTRMFIKKDMMVILDGRRVNQLALALYRFRSGDIRLSQEDDEWLNRADPDRGALYQSYPQMSAAPRSSI